ncbi:hypothetical protein [Saccharomonospora iraqiensis]|uniref:hypothetical protein n=1 Tax=Saccharomonospora iraqiensis TaxID=52698 RepID=UPI00022DF843|nr:hypothetical protein [Saccharomonospora iraqiensis]
MGGLVLACGDATDALPTGDLRVTELPERPGRTDVDPVLEPSLIVAGTDADLAAVVLRLLRRELLADTVVGFVPTRADSAVAALWSLPTDPHAALERARGGVDRPVPLIRNDAGGVLVGSGVLPRVRGRAYCDDTVALHGPSRSVEVHAGEDGLVVTVTRGRLVRRRTRHTGRAFQIACDPVVPVSDGVPHPRSMTGWTWYRHTSDLRLVR